MDTGYLKIGDISKLTNTPIKTLRYYDKIDLIKPGYVDVETNFRYYSHSHILALNIIKKLKLEGFTLKEIKELISNTNFENFIKLYKTKIKNIDNEISNLQKVKSRLNSRLDLLLNTRNIKDSINKNIIIETKQFPKREYISIRNRCSLTVESVLNLCNKVMYKINESNVNIALPYFSICHGDYSTLDTNNVDFELCAFVQSSSINNDNNLKTLPEGLYVYSIYQGGYEISKVVYNNIIKWINDNGYFITGPVIRMYIYGIEFARSIDQLIIEIQIPVKK